MKIFSNGFWLIVPILIWNAIFYNRLPAQYQPEIFEQDIQSYVSFGESTLRVVIFGMPLLFSIGLSTKTQKFGLGLYFLGVMMYFMSWLPLIFTPRITWSSSLVGFAAPAYTPILWLIGIALLGECFYFPFEYKPVYFLIPSVLFSIFHCEHVVTVYFNNI